MAFWRSCRDFWRTYGWHVLLGGIVLTFLILFIINQYSVYNKAPSVSMSDIYNHFLGFFFRPPVDRQSFSHQRQRRLPGGKSRGEFQCKEFVEFFFQKAFSKVRPDFLKNPVTKENLELDIYNEELKLAVEYNGAQHYHYNSFMHKNSKDRFQNQQYRDLIKQDLCAKHVVSLIVVPFTIEPNEIASFLFNEFKSLGFEPHPSAF